MPDSRKVLQDVVDQLRGKYPAEFAVAGGDLNLIAAEYLKLLDHGIEHYKSSLSMNLGAQAAGQK